LLNKLLVVSFITTTTIPLQDGKNALVLASERGFTDIVFLLEVLYF
jgi:hypothetical protein